MKIGIMDSGIGGVSVLNELLLQLPEEEFVYYADTAHVPYGEKSRAEVIGYTDAAVDFLLRHDAKAVVIACNTATSAAISVLRQKYTLPLIGIEPAVKPALRDNDGRRVLVMATPLTLRETKLHTLLGQLDTEHCVDLLPMPGLVRFAERREFDSAAVDEYCREQLASYDKNAYSSLVMGCTHFNYFKDTLRRLFPGDTRFIDGCDGTARNLRHILNERGQLAVSRDRERPQVEFFFSGRAASAAERDDMSALLRRAAVMREI